jgi:hypothetical protein
MNDSVDVDSYVKTYDRRNRDMHARPAVCRWWSASGAARSGRAVVAIVGVETSSARRVRMIVRRAAYVLTS